MSGAGVAFIYLGIGAGVLLLALLILTLWRNGLIRVIEIEDRRAQARMMGGELASLKGRVEALAEISMNGQGRLDLALHERLDRVSLHAGWNLEEIQSKTEDNPEKPQEIMTIIDRSQKLCLLG
jgi:hypothetical protein